MNIPNRLVWVDLETTGLDPAKDLILELAIVVTDSKLNEVAYASWVVKQDVDWTKVHPVVLEMHTANGLKDDVPDGLPIRDIESAACAMLDDLGIKEKGPICGSSPHFDMSFLQQKYVWDGEYFGMRELAKRFNHRVFDVSTLKLAEMMRVQAVCSPATVVRNEPAVAHRALSDIRGSIEAARKCLGL